MALYYTNLALGLYAISPDKTWAPMHSTIMGVDSGGQEGRGPPGFSYMVQIY